MMDMTDKLMVLLFPFLDTIPFTMPRYWIFRDRLRIPFRYVVLVQLALTAVYSASFYAVDLGGYEAAARWTTLLRYGFMMVYLACAFLLIKDSLPKLLFTWLLTLAWQFFVMGNANFIESRFFPDVSGQHPYLVYNTARIVIYLIICPFLLRFFLHTVTDALKIEDQDIWRSFWKIPLFSMLFGILYCTVTDVYAFASWQFLLSRYFMLFGSCYVSCVALRMLEISRGRAQLEEALRYADLNLLTQKKQFDALAAHMDDVRKARHDMRQHFAAVQSYIDRDDKTGLAAYIHACMETLPIDMAEYFCANDVMNAIISYYAAQARDSGIGFQAKVTCPKDCPVSATDMTVLLGNLLENAVEACRREADDGRFIRLKVTQRGQAALLILVDNTCQRPVVFEDGTPLSSKRDGVGVGIASVREIAGRYSGSVQLEQEDGVFCVSVWLTLP